MATQQVHSRSALVIFCSLLYVSVPLIFFCFSLFYCRLYARFHFTFFLIAHSSHINAQHMAHRFKFWIFPHKIALGQVFLCSNENQNNERILFFLSLCSVDMNFYGLFWNLTAAVCLTHSFKHNNKHWKRQTKIHTERRETQKV